MSQERMLKTLESLGFTQTDSHVYLLLSKKGPQKACEIAKILKTPKQTIYFTLKNMQNRGVITSTVERPARFSVVSFERVLDLFVKTRMEEAQRIQRDKDEILSDWKSIAIKEDAEPAQKFTVFKGKNVIFAKIQQMAQTSKQNFFAIGLIPNLLRVIEFGIFDSLTQKNGKDHVDYRILTISNEKNNGMKNLQKLSGLLKIFDEAEIRVADIGCTLGQMAIRDNEEAVFFIDSNSNETEQEDLCLWTNCKSIISSLASVFNDSWWNSTELSIKIKEMEKGIQSPKTIIFKNSIESIEKYSEILNLSKKSVFVLTSSPGLKQWSKAGSRVKAWMQNGVTVKIMAPIAAENLAAAQNLSNVCEVKHVPTGLAETVIIDGQHLFQFKEPSSKPKKAELSKSFENTFYTNDSGHVSRMENIFCHIWKSAQIPSLIALKKIISEPSSSNPSNPEIIEEYRKIIGFEWIREPSTRKEVVDSKRINIEANTDKLCIFGCMGCGVIYPQADLKLPNFIIQAYKADERSTFGNENFLLLYIQMKVLDQSTYLPAAFVTDNQQGYDFRLRMHKNLQTTETVMLVKKDEIEVQVKGVSLFAGWSIPIPLFKSQYTIQPAYVTFNGHGDSQEYCSEIIGPFNRRINYNYDSVNAFVNFVHPNQNYSGPATDGLLQRNLRVISYPL